jgi:eukaryotic-like serine/threonine-protein kinase
MTDSHVAPDQLEALVRAWQERYDRGEDPIVAELCQDCPNLAPLLERRIGTIRHFERMITSPPEQTSDGPERGATTDLASPESLLGTRVWDSIGEDGVGGPIPMPPGYEVLGKLGEGGMGVVFKARHLALNRIEVVKMIRAGEFAGPRDLTRFRFEAEAAANLDHPHIVPVFGVGDVAGRPYLAMRWIDGASLAERRPTTARETAELVAKVARAVHHAHQRGILHRDLKPANILLDQAGEPFVTDFGVARRIGADAAPTQSGGIVGTPQYMAPEQALGDPHLTVGADIYALGGILYFCLTDRPPFSGKSYVDVLSHVTSSPPAAPRTVHSGVDPELEAVCLKCLEKSPSDRYPTAVAVADDLEHYVRGEGVSARAPGLFDWLKQLWRAQPQPSYSWEVLVWFGAIMFVTHVLIFCIVRADGILGWVWLTNVLSWIGVCWVLYWYMARRFRRLPPAERHNMMIALGHSLASVALTCALVPAELAAPASASLPVFPALLALAGLSFFVVGSTHWSRFFPIGLGMMALAPLASLWSEASPLLYGLTTTATLWFWAYAKKVMFSHGRDPTESSTSPTGYK